MPLSTYYFPIIVFVDGNPLCSLYGGYTSQPQWNATNTGVVDLNIGSHTIYAQAVSTTGVGYVTWNGTVTLSKGQQLLYEFH